jgi:DNA polymerase-1
VALIVTDEGQLRDLVEEILDVGEFAFDCETVGTDLETLADIRLDPWKNEVVWLSFATRGKSFTLPIGHPHGEQVGTHKEPRVGSDGKTRMFSVPTWSPAPRQIEPAEAFGILEPLFFTVGVLKIGHNIKFDLESIMKYYDLDVPPPDYFDTMIALQLLDENRHDYRLGTVIKREFGFVYDKSLGQRIERYGFKDSARYAHFDAKWTWLLKERFEPMIAPDGLAGVHQLEMDVLEVLLYMERDAVLLDVEAATKLKASTGREIDRLKGECFREAGGREINFNSTQQMQQPQAAAQDQGGSALDGSRVDRAVRVAEPVRGSLPRAAGRRQGPRYLPDRLPRRRGGEDQLRQDHRRVPTIDHGRRGTHPRELQADRHGHGPVLVRGRGHSRGHAPRPAQAAGRGPHH